MQAENHFADYNFMEKQQRLEKFDMEKPSTFINRPLTRAQLRRRFMRSVGKQEIEFRNGALICKFLNDSGKLYNRFQTRLTSSVHRKVAKTVKKMRHLGLLPFVGVLKPTDKIPLGNFIDDVEEMHKKTIDPVTGRMYLRHTL
jgi:ribosomal protein S18